jgi:hypothetical protein
MNNITIGQLVAAQPAFRKLLNADLKLSLALSLRRLAREIISELGVYEAERLKLLSKWAKTEKGKVVEDDKGEASFEGDRREKFQSALMELLASPASLGADPIDLAAFASENIKLSPVEAAALDPFLAEIQHKETKQ